MKIRNITITCSTLCILFCLLPLHLFAACPPTTETDARATAFLQNRPLDLYPTELSLADAYCVQEKYVIKLIPHYGQPIGYKIGFAGKALQERFQVSEPAFGILLEKMLLPDGATFSLSSAFRPMIEPDMIVN